MEEKPAETSDCSAAEGEPQQGTVPGSEKNSSDTVVTEVQQSQSGSDPKVKNLQCNIYQHPVDSVEQAGRLANLLKVIAQDKRVCKKTPSLRHGNPGPSGPSQGNTKPLRKAKHSWQVKNLSGQTSNQSSLPVEVGESVNATSDEEEPPLKKARLEESASSAVPSSSSTEHPSDRTINDPSVLQTDKARAEELPESGQGDTAEKSQAEKDIKAKLPGASSSPQGDGQEASSERRPVDVYSRWQSRHVAQAIVDNAINATLEVLGISLASDNPRAGRTMAAQRQTLEDNALSVIIRTRGLQGPESDSSDDNAQDGDEPRPSSSNTDSVTTKVECTQVDTSSSVHASFSGEAQRTAPHVAQLDPLISQLTHFSETMLVRNEFDEVAIGQTQSQDNPSSPSVSGSNPAHAVDDSGSSATSHPGAVDFEPPREPYDKTYLHQKVPDLDTLFTPSLQTDVLDKAVSAAISQKGLAMDGNL